MKARRHCLPGTCAALLAATFLVHGTMGLAPTGQLHAVVLPARNERVEVRNATTAQCEHYAASSVNMWLGPSPWLQMKCWLQHADLQARHQLSLLRIDPPVYMPLGLKSQQDDEPFFHIDFTVILNTTIFVLAIGFTFFGLRDLHGFVNSFTKSASSEGISKDEAFGASSYGSTERNAQDAEELDQISKQSSQTWSMSGMLGLCALRFYTGFLSATWLPYLLAMEGQDLFGEKQALFMALAKLIFGISILLNPIFGLIGDRAVMISHGTGRRLFLRAGVTLACLGIYICVLAGKERALSTFLIGIFVWRLGEALNDVTTEALMPEMVPQEQFALAGAIKASTFLLGGLCGYIVLIVFADMHYSWLYYIYPFGMFCCVLPSIWLLDRDQPLRTSKQACEPNEHSTGSPSFNESMYEAYVTPARYKGGFPNASLAVFLFGLGTSPMFFLLLVVRDLVGIADPAEAQKQFSWGSICFFLAAAVASGVAAMLDKSRRPPQLQHQDRMQGKFDAEALASRSRLLVFSMVCCAICISLLPLIVLWSTRESRLRIFFLMITIFGSSFGLSYTLFQDLTWKILPQEANLACAMGFNVMSRLFGVGVGNCICGVILDLSLEGGQRYYGEDVYSTSGYIVMCSFSGAAMFASTYVARLAVRQALQEENCGAEEKTRGK